MIKYYTPGYGMADVLIMHGLVYFSVLLNYPGRGYVETIDDDRFVIYAPEIKISDVSVAVIKAVDEIPDGDRDIRSRLLKDVGDPVYMLLAKLGYYHGALRYHVVNGPQYVLTFVPKPGMRVDAEIIRRLQNAIRNYIGTHKPLYGTVEYVVQQILREVHFSVTYNYYLLDYVCAILWTIWNGEVYQHKMCSLEFIRHIYDPRRI